jgi:two-component sensor histidine kinase
MCLVEGHTSHTPMDPPSREASDPRQLFHRLTNQLGIILANAELLEAKSSDETSRARAVQVISSALEAMATVTDLRRHIPPSSLA